MADPAQITTEFTTPPDAPVEGSGFRAQAAAFLSFLVSFGTKLVAFVTEVNALSTQVNSESSAAVTAASTATTAAGTAATKAAEATTAAGTATTKATEAATARDEAVAAAASLDTSTLIPKSIGTAAGDLIYFTEAGIPAALAKGINGKTLTMVDGSPTWSDAAGGLTDVRVTAGQTLEPAHRYRAYLTATATFPLPSSPAAGDTIEIWDCGRNFASYPAVVTGSVEGDAEGITLDLTGSRTLFTYDATTVTWSKSSVVEA